MGIIKNILTLGADYRIKKEEKVYASILSELRDVNSEMEVKKIEVNAVLLNIVKVKMKAVKSLNKITKITKNIKGKQREFITSQVSQEKINWDFEYIENTLRGVNIALNAGKGAGAGAATSTAAYYLVGQFATASTGTSISTLYGAAATKATLAWLGGGTIATGGGGVAAGTVVLGGLVAIPALAVMGIFNHWSANKQIKIIKEKEYEVMKRIDETKKNILALDLMKKRANEIGLSVEKAAQVFKIEFKKVYRRIYPIPFLSKLIKNIKKLFGYNYYNEKDIHEISYIGNIATNLAKLIDTKVIEDT